MRNFIRILENADLYSWFSGSKVVDHNGKPLICYHGTSHEFNVFLPLSHFGSEYAAKSRLAHTKQNGSLHAVYLNIKSPLRFVDSGRGSDFIMADVINSTPDDLWEDLTEAEVDEMIDGDTDMVGLFCDYLGDCGYDGLVYSNKVEGKGEDSWVVLSPDQVRPVYA